MQGDPGPGLGILVGHLKTNHQVDPTARVRVDPRPDRAVGEDDSGCVVLQGGGKGPDRSMADFTWCMTAIDWGWPIEETAIKLPEFSEKARERVQTGDEGYPLITAQNAAAAVERNAMKRGRG